MRKIFPHIICQDFLSIYKLSDIELYFSAFSREHRAVLGGLDVCYRRSSTFQGYHEVFVVPDYMHFPQPDFSFPLYHSAYQTVVHDVFLYHKAHIYNVHCVPPSPLSCYRQIVFR